MYTVRMDGYSRAKIDKIFFKFKGYPFQEYYTLTAQVQHRTAIPSAGVA